VTSPLSAPLGEAPTGDTIVDYLISVKLFFLRSVKFFAKVLPMAQTTTKDGLLTTEQAAKLAGMSRQALQGHIDAGRIEPFVMVGRLRLFSRESISKWLQDRNKNGITKRGPQAKKNGHRGKK